MLSPSLPRGVASRSPPKPARSSTAGSRKPPPTLPAADRPSARRCALGIRRRDGATRYVRARMSPETADSATFLDRGLDLICASPPGPRSHTHRDGGRAADFRTGRRPRQRRCHIVHAMFLRRLPYVRNKNPRVSAGATTGVIRPGLWWAHSAAALVALRTNNVVLGRGGRGTGNV